ncbi:hypothetical protein PRK78_000993 [Emydomyces testavorans]|uniref:Uncharacterized protein n=1 Tax=Emydomyces testavorans TaxID=2070801 RepID=A0AAF0DBP1_9EURO|nr:hypothetical protein PRK78_000993 [Emydomyces testavorans]
MLPPSDSINHQNLKLAEFVASLQNQTTLPAPPPPYAVVQSNDDVLGELEDDEDDGLPLAPIVLKVDTSITIDGHANTVAIPTPLSGGCEDGQGFPSETSSATSNSGLIRQLQQQRQAKSAQIASSVVSALKSCGVLDDRESGKTRPVEISIDAGIHIKGAKNVVCSGIRRRMETTSTAGVGDPQGLERKRRAQSEPFEQPILKRRNA